jgi:hypothetical protein
MTRLKAIRLIFLVMAVTVVLPAGRSDSGQRSSAHQDIWLRNETGDRITPTDNAAEPYSPRKTCGACHHYPTIVQGDHFRMGSPAKKADPSRANLPLELLPGEGRPAPYGGAAIYDWIAANASYHPGGGPMECLNLRPAGGTPTNLVEAERIVSSSRNPHFQSRLTPDGHSRFKAKRSPGRGLPHVPPETSTALSGATPRSPPGTTGGRPRRAQPGRR